MKNGTAISGATTSTLSLSSVNMGDSGASYTVTVTDSAGTVTSTAAVLRVTGLRLLAGKLGGEGFADESSGNPTKARFVLPVAVAVGPAGNVFVLDENVVREITTSGNVKTLAGSPLLSAGYNVDNYTTFAYPHALAVSPDGSMLYVADSGDLVIRKVSTTDGSTSLFAGTVAQSSFNPANCTPTPTTVCFTAPDAIAVDGSGNVVVEDGSPLMGNSAVFSPTLYEFTPLGVAATLATDTAQADPSAISINSAANELVAADDTYVGYLQYPPPSGSTVQPIAGAPGSPQGGSTDSAPGDTTGLNARFGCSLSGSAWYADLQQLDFAGLTYGASGIATSPNGMVAYVADTCNDTIRSVQLPSGITSTLAGVADSAGTANGFGANARFNGPTSVATDSFGNLYVADALNATIRKVTPEGQVSLFAGEPATMGSAEGNGPNARFFAPTGVAVDSKGNIFVADTMNDVIREISPSGAVSLYAGSPGKAGYQDGDALGVALFDQPDALAIDSHDDLYVADSCNNVIREITPNGVVSTYAGQPPTGSVACFYSNAGFKDGTPSTAQFNDPDGLAIDAAGNLFVADNSNCAIREIVAATASAPATVVTVAGDVVSGSPVCASQSTPQSDGTGSSGANPAVLGNPTGIAIDQAGNVYFSSVAFEVNVTNGTFTYGATVNKLTAPGTATSTVTAIAGSQTTVGAHDGQNNAALFRAPHGLAVDAKGDIFVADAYNHAIREISFSGGNALVTTVVGTLDDPSATSFKPVAPIGVVVGGLPGELNEPVGIAMVSAGTKSGSGVTLAVTDSAENSVLLVDVD